MEGQGDAETLQLSRAQELLARAARIRERSTELSAALGPDHSLVAQAIERAEYLEREAATPDHIDLR